MHEFSTTERLFQIALTKAELREGERIRRLQIALDPDSSYVPDAIRFYFEQLARGTSAEGAELDFELTPMPQPIALQEIEVEEVTPLSPAALRQAQGAAQETPQGAAGEAEPKARWQLQIGGVIQGVGFRPFLFNLAHQLGLNGWVRNSSTGVEMELQGPAGEFDHFLYHLRQDAPPLARILAVETTSIPPIPDQPLGLEIRASQNGTGRTLVSPDVATCPRCLSEIFTPTDRRYGYPFTNCTHCGPRFTIILDLPYDRPLTTMANFPLCPACAGEYRNPNNHRFHAQPIACPECGPKLWYADHEVELTLRSDRVINAVALAGAIRCLDRGGTVALKGLGGFHLACRADRVDAVKKLRAAKNRPDKPLAVMVRSLAEAAEFCHVSPAEQALLAAPEAPIVLLRKRTETGTRILAPEIAPHNGYLGLMLPYTPLHHLLLQAAAGPLVMTSGNGKGDPLCLDNTEAWAKLRPYCDGFLLHDRPIARRCDDSVMFVAEVAGQDRALRQAQEGPQGAVQPVRRSRGLAPLPVLLPSTMTLSTPLVAAGADLKNVSAVAVDRHVFLTQHIGDLSNFNTRQEQAQVIADFEQLFGVKPAAVVCDLHPDYASSRYARDRAAREGLPLLEVQHHHAHLAGCLAENNHLDPAIGLAFDGTGYGPDGCIWGGEILLADLGGFRRLYQLEYLPLPGGDAATRHPERITLAYLRALLPEVEAASLLPGLTGRESHILETMLAQGLNTPLTSSMGRLFDAVSGLLGLCHRVTYEGQAAIALEAAALASDFSGPGYDFFLEDGQIRLATLFSQLVADRRKGAPIPDIARRFHQTVAQMAVTGALAAHNQANRVNHVALSGGVWQNRLLLELAVPLLRQTGFEVLLHHAIPANDGGLAYGQVAVAAAQLAKLDMD